MSEFALLYRSTNEAHDAAMGTPERTRETMARWRVWFDGMAANGQLKSIGLPLYRTGRVVRGPGKSITDGPYAETKEIVGGFSIIEARDVAHAAEIAAACPIVALGGVVEVRPVMTLPG
jgi:hypothetical protein